MDEVTLSEAFAKQAERAVEANERRRRVGVGRFARWHKKGGGGSGSEHMLFDITAVDCVGGTVSTEDASILRFTGTGTPSGADAYTGVYEIEDVLGLMGGYTEAQLLAARGYAIRWYTYPGSTAHWELLLLTWTGGC